MEGFARSVCVISDRSGIGALHGAASGIRLKPIEVSAPVQAWCVTVLDRLQVGIGTPDDAVVVILPSRVHPPWRLLRDLVASGVDDVIPQSDPRFASLLHDSIEQIARLVAHSEALARNGLTGSSRAMRNVRKQLARALVGSDAPVLLLGETGTGKQCAARALHASDRRRSQAPFHWIDCGAIVEGLLGSELFGHLRGAFTGAGDHRPGAFAIAEDGTLLLDEIGELPARLQASFLGALQERAYRPVGSDRAHPIRCRVLAATNRDLPAQVSRGEFRADLFHRLDGFRVTLPPLRERLEDLPALFRSFVEQALRPARSIEIDDDVFAALACHRFAGNVRELQQVSIRAAAALGSGSRIRVIHLSLSEETAADGAGRETIEDMVRAGLPMERIRTECERRAARAALALAGNGGEISATRMKEDAARRLAVSPRWIYDRLRECGPA